MYKLLSALTAIASVHVNWWIRIVTGSSGRLLMRSKLNVGCHGVMGWLGGPACVLLSVVPDPDPSPAQHSTVSAVRKERHRSIEHRCEVVDGCTHARRLSESSSARKVEFPDWRLLWSNTGRLLRHFGILDYGERRIGDMIKEFGDVSYAVLFSDGWSGMR